ncbi:hypothetical protein V1VFAS_141 [Rhizobium phage V1VFA-S]|nr:hypothetical protein V1VFAS_141 [Rhizobium phage V1VFA-S]
MQVANETHRHHHANLAAHDRKEIAKIIALAQPNLFTSDQQRRRVLLTALQKKFRDDRRIFRRMAGGHDRGLKLGYHSWADREVYTYTRKLVLRVASKLNLLQSTFIFNYHASYRSEKLTSIDAFHGSNPINQTILISPNQRDAAKFLEARYHANRHHRKADDLTTVFVVKKMSAELRAKIEEVANHYKFQVEVLPYPERKKPTKRGEKVEKKLFHAFSQVKSENSYVFRISENKKLATAPKYYMNVRGGLENLSIPRRFWPLRDDFTKHFGEIALANSTKVEAKLKLMGAKDIELVLMDEMRAIAKTREVAFSYLCQQGKLISSGTYRDPSYMVASLMKTDMRFSHFFFPDTKIVRTAAVEKAEFLTAIMADRYRSGTKGYAEYQKMWADVDAAAKAEFKDIRLNSKEANQRFEFLKPLAVGTFSLPDETNAYDLDEILAVMKWLKARHERKAKNATPNNDNAHKEAA